MNQNSETKRQLLFSEEFRDKLNDYLASLEIDVVYDQLYDFWWEYFDKQDIDFINGFIDGGEL